MSVYVGIDVHRKQSQVAVVTEGGGVAASNRHERGQARLHRARHPGHPAGQRNGRSPGASRQDQQERSLTGR